MGDRKRFSIFSKEIFSKFPPNKYKRIADVAGGKGYLNYELKKMGYKVVTFDKRRRKRSGVTFVYRLFDKKIKDTFDLLVGMHPDEATDVIITESAKRRIPFAIVPCCIKTTDTVFFGNHNHNEWVHHLDMYARKLGFNTNKKQLKMTGKNIMMWGT